MPSPEMPSPEMPSPELPSPGYRHDRRGDAHRSRLSTKRPCHSLTAASATTVDAMTTSEQFLQLHGPGDLLEAVPYLLSFRPRESLVLVGLAGQRVVVTLRMDLARSECAEQLAETVATMARTGLGAVVLVVYLDAHDGAPLPLTTARGLPRQAVVEETRDMLAAAGIPVLDSLLVMGSNWWSYSGWDNGDSCCRLGHRLSGESSSTAAAAVFAGLPAYPDRGALEAVLDPDPELERSRRLSTIRAREDEFARMALTDRLMHTQRSVKRALFAAARESDRALLPRVALAIPDTALARYGVGLRDVAIRDSLWLAVDQGRLDGRGFWHVLLQHLPVPYDSAPLLLFGWASWREGNGALAAIAAQRALASNPGYTAAELLLNAVQQGLDPFRTPRLRPPGRRT